MLESKPASYTQKASFTRLATLHKQTQEQCTLYYFSVVSLSWMKWGLDLICIVVLSYQRKNCFAWLHKYSQTESRIFYPRAVLYVINSGGPCSVNGDMRFWPYRFSDNYVEMASGLFSDNVVSSEGKFGKSEVPKKSRENPEYQWQGWYLSFST